MSAERPRWVSPGNQGEAKDHSLVAQCPGVLAGCRGEAHLGPKLIAGEAVRDIVQKNEGTYAC